MEDLVARVKQAGVDIVLATPPPFDPRPVADGSSCRSAPRNIGFHDLPYRRLRRSPRRILGAGCSGEAGSRAGRWSTSTARSSGSSTRIFKRSTRASPSSPDGVHPRPDWPLADGPGVPRKPGSAPSEVDCGDDRFQDLPKAKAGNVESIVRRWSGDFTPQLDHANPDGPRPRYWDVRLASLRADRRAGSTVHRAGHSPGSEFRSIGSSPSIRIFEGDRNVRFLARSYDGPWGLNLHRQHARLSTNRRAAEVRIAGRRAADRSSPRPGWRRSAIGPARDAQDPAARRRPSKRPKALEARIRELAKPTPIHLRLERLPGQ